MIPAPLNADGGVHLVVEHDDGLTRTVTLRLNCRSHYDAMLLVDKIERETGFGRPLVLYFEADMVRR